MKSSVRISPSPLTNKNHIQKNRDPCSSDLVSKVSSSSPSIPAAGPAPAITTESGLSGAGVTPRSSNGANSVGDSASFSKRNTDPSGSQGPWSSTTSSSVPSPSASGATSSSSGLAGRNVENRPLDSVQPRHRLPPQQPPSQTPPSQAPPATLPKNSSWSSGLQVIVESRRERASSSQPQHRKAQSALPSDLAATMSTSETIQASMGAAPMGAPPSKSSSGRPRRSRRKTKSDLGQLMSPWGEVGYTQHPPQQYRQQQPLPPPTQHPHHHYYGQPNGGLMPPGTVLYPPYYSQAAPGANYYVPRMPAPAPVSTSPTSHHASRARPRTSSADMTPAEANNRPMPPSASSTTSSQIPPRQQSSHSLAAYYYAGAPTSAPGPSNKMGPSGPTSSSPPSTLYEGQPAPVYEAVDPRLMAWQVQQQMQQQRGQPQDGRKHRKSLSTSAAFPMGAFWQGDLPPGTVLYPTGPGLATNAPPPGPASGSNQVSSSTSTNANNSPPMENSLPKSDSNKSFQSPRGEILSLTSSLRKSRSTDAGVAGAAAPKQHRKVASMVLSSPPPGHPPMSPRRDPSLTQSLRNMTWSSVAMHPHQADVHLSPTVDPTFMAIPDYGSRSGAPLPSRGGAPSGEAVYMAQRRNKSESSTRKTQMRQQSVQLLMEEIKGVEQPLACRHVFFLLLFVFHLLFIIYLGDLYGKEALRSHSILRAAKTDSPMGSLNEGEEEVEEVTIHYNSLVFLACFSGAFAIVLSTLLLGAMTMFARKFVQVALMMVITLSFIWGTIGIGLSPQTAVPITGIIALALTVAYAFIVWDRIPFAAANLLTALTGIRAFPTTVLVAFGFQILALGWSVYYAVVVCGIYDAIQEGKLAVTHRVAVLIYVLLGISYNWTFQVLLNSVQAITAYVIGTWWHAPDSTNVVTQSFFRTVFYKMGSICLGSLFVGPARLIRQLSVLVKPTAPEESSLLCFHECLFCVQSCMTSCVDGISQRFNGWAITYVGLYGYGFLEGGQHATILFEKRGWTKIASDDLVPNVLLMASLAIGGVTGCFAHVLAKIDRLHVVSIDKPGLMAFVEGVVIGWVLSSVLFSVISSAVAACLVCFASSPVDLEENHPDLSREMRAAWREVWPGALDTVDLRSAIAASFANRSEERIPLV